MENQTTTEDVKPIGFTYACPCGRKPTRMFADTHLAKRAMKHHKKRNHGQTGCRRLKAIVVPVMPAEVQA